MLGWGAAGRQRPLRTGVCGWDSKAYKEAEPPRGRLHPHIWGGRPRRPHHGDPRWPCSLRCRDAVTPVMRTAGSASSVLPGTATPIGRTAARRGSHPACRASSAHLTAGRACDRLRTGGAPAGGVRGGRQSFTGAGAAPLLWKGAVLRRSTLERDALGLVTRLIGCLRDTCWPDSRPCLRAPQIEGILDVRARTAQSAPRTRTDTEACLVSCPYVWAGCVMS